MLENDQQAKEKGLALQDRRERILVTKGYLTQVIGDKATRGKGGSRGKSATEVIAVKRNFHCQVILKRNFHLKII